MTDRGLYSGLAFFTVVAISQIFPLRLTKETIFPEGTKKSSVKNAAFILGLRSVS
jgi:hypothetical protein